MSLTSDNQFENESESTVSQSSWKGYRQLVESYKRWLVAEATDRSGIRRKGNSRFMKPLLSSAVPTVTKDTAHCDSDL